MENLIPKDAATADYMLQGFSPLTAANPDQWAYGNHGTEGGTQSINFSYC